MSKIDIERLKVDAEYWLESDPSDGEATHYEECYSGHECAWVRVDRKGNRHYFHNSGWVCTEGTGDEIGSVFGSVESMIPRPTKQEWDGKGLPPVGVECEFIHPGITSEGWQVGKIKAYFDDRVVIKSNPSIWPSCGYAVILIDEELKFRPPKIPTRETEGGRN